MRTILAASLIASLAAPVAFAGTPAAGDDAHAEHEAYPEISIKELKALVASKKVVVIDANGTESFKEGHIPGALDFEAVSTDLASKLPEDKTTLLVAYCGGPRCGAWKKAADAASALGYTKIQHLKAGISGWKSAEAPVEI